MDKLETVEDYQKASNFWTQYRLITDENYHLRQKIEALDKENEVLREALGRNVNFSISNKNLNLEDSFRYTEGIKFKAEIMVTGDVISHRDFEKIMPEIVRKLSEELAYNILNKKYSNIRYALLPNLVTGNIDFPNNDRSK